MAADPSGRLQIVQSTSRPGHSEGQFLVSFDPSGEIKFSLSVMVTLTKYNPTVIKMSNNAEDFRQKYLILCRPRNIYFMTHFFNAVRRT
jgi:hypothetical protein